MTGKILFWCSLMFLFSSCNAHYLDMRDHSNPTPFVGNNRSDHLSLMLDQMLSTRIDTLVANADIGGASHSLSMMVRGDARLDAVTMKSTSVHEFNTMGQLQLNCLGSHCDGAQFSGNVAIGINHSTQHLSIHSINIGDDKNQFMLKGSVEKYFGNGDTDTILNVGTVALILSTQNEDIALDQSGVVGVNNLPQGADTAFTGAIELSHELSQTYLEGRVKSVSD